ncbi:Maltose O-acetyltransferase [Sandaracinus amylolyticus]|uniref:Maltose O-acetyltransferase n=1 Tax=Sandaracinus amylolyticus TaxID=927083 RepID=A0A0F6YF29_9BACT|nr:Maltose O-acetyltransferase [Sandaracinus amylolyticus]
MVLETGTPPRSRFDPREVVGRVARRARWHVQRRHFHTFGRDSHLERHVALHRPEAISIGREVSIRRFARLEVVGNDPHRPILQIGDHCMISEFVHIGAATSVILRAGSGLAAHVLIIDHEHDLRDPADFRNDRVIAAPIDIGEQVFVGERACILRGVTIGAHSIIGAGSVVNCDIPPLSVAVGAPARVVKRWDARRGEWVSVGR